LSDFGSELETFIFVVALVLALMLVLVTFLPWMAKYLPWRIERLQRVRAAHRAIRKAPKVADTHVERVLAMRAVTRLDYPTLLEYSPDPLGDWASGRHDRLARAELASVGLRP
jgi:Flp pilus assembly protein TadB